MADPSLPPWPPPSSSSSPYDSAIGNMAASGEFEFNPQLLHPPPLPVVGQDERNVMSPVPKWTVSMQQLLQQHHARDQVESQHEPAHFSEKGKRKPSDISYHSLNSPTPLGHSYGHSHELPSQTRQRLSYQNTSRILQEEQEPWPPHSHMAATAPGPPASVGPQPMVQHQSPLPLSMPQNVSTPMVTLKDSSAGDGKGDGFPMDRVLIPSSSYEQPWRRSAEQGKGWHHHHQHHHHHHHNQEVMWFPEGGQVGVNNGVTGEPILNITPLAQSQPAAAEGQLQQLDTSGPVMPGGSSTVKAVSGEEGYHMSARKIHKADREKLRRGRLNEQFTDLAVIIDPEKPKNDKATILGDSLQMVRELKLSVKRLKADHVSLLEEQRELTNEKAELREEKTKLKEETESLQAQLQERMMAMVPWMNLSHPFMASQFPPVSSSLLSSSSPASPSQPTSTTPLPPHPPPLPLSFPSSPHPPPLPLSPLEVASSLDPTATPPSLSPSLPPSLPPSLNPSMENSNRGCSPTSPSLGSLSPPPPPNLPLPPPYSTHLRQVERTDSESRQPSKKLSISGNEGHRDSPSSPSSPSLLPPASHHMHSEPQMESRRTSPASLRPSRPLSPTLFQQQKLNVSSHSPFSGPLSLPLPLPNLQQVQAPSHPLSNSLSHSLSHSLSQSHFNDVHSGQTSPPSNPHPQSHPHVHTHPLSSSLSPSRPSSPKTVSESFRAPVSPSPYSQQPLHHHPSLHSSPTAPYPATYLSPSPNHTLSLHPPVGAYQSVSLPLPPAHPPSSDSNPSPEIPSPPSLSHDFYTQLPPFSHSAHHYGPPPLSIPQQSAQDHPFAHFSAIPGLSPTYLIPMQMMPPSASPSSTTTPSQTVYSPYVTQHPATYTYTHLPAQQMLMGYPMYSIPGQVPMNTRSLLSSIPPPLHSLQSIPPLSPLSPLGVSPPMMPHWPYQPPQSQSQRESQSQPQSQNQSQHQPMGTHLLAATSEGSPSGPIQGRSHHNDLRLGLVPSNGIQGPSFDSAPSSMTFSIGPPNQEAGTASAASSGSSEKAERMPPGKASLSHDPTIRPAAA